MTRIEDLTKNTADFEEWTLAINLILSDCESRVRGKEVEIEATEKNCPDLREWFDTEVDAYLAVCFIHQAEYHRAFAHTL